MNSLLLFMLTQNHLFLYLTALAADDDAECLKTNTVILPWCLSITCISMCSLEAEFGLCDIKWVKFWLLINTMCFHKCPNWGKSTLKITHEVFLLCLPGGVDASSILQKAEGSQIPRHLTDKYGLKLWYLQRLSLGKKHVDISHFCSL